MKQEELLNKIDPYLWDTLPEDVATEFEDALENDAEAQEEFALRQLENDVIKQLRREELQAKMKAWHEEKAETVSTETKVVQMQPTQTTMRVATMRPIYWVAAAALAVLVVAGGRFFAINNYGNAVLTAEFAEKTAETPTETEETGLGAGTPTIDIVQYANAAQTAFEAKNYSQAIPLFEALAKETTLLTEVRQGIEWKLLVSYLGNGQTTEGSPFRLLLAKTAANPKHAFQKHAIALQQKVNSLWWQMAN